MRKTHPNLRRRTFFTPLLMPVIAGIAALAAAVWFYSSLDTTTVVLVRHAEKQQESGNDPALTGEGVSRARVLASVLGDTGIDALFASQYRRTQATLAPLSELAGVPVEIIDAGQPEQLVERVLSEHRGQIVVIAGHSNTIPDLVMRLSGIETPAIDESDYSGIYVVSLPRFGEARLLRLSYPD